MSVATVLTLPTPGHTCPAWCTQDATAEAAGSHASAAVHLSAPEFLAQKAEVPLLSVQISLGHDEEARGEPPRLWLAAADGAAELDLDALGSLIGNLERAALDLRGLRHRFDKVIRGGAPEAVDHWPSPGHPLELVAPCPPWCQFRDEAEHTPTGLLAEHFHASQTYEAELGLPAVTRDEYGLRPHMLELGLAHMSHAQLPQIDLTVHGGEGWKYVALTMDEAEEMRAQLNEFIACGREFAQPDAVPTLQEVTSYCDVRIIESDAASKDFYGHAVGDTRQGGPVWVTVPKYTTGPRLENQVFGLLAELHESQGVPDAQGGTEIRQAGRAPGVPRWPAFGAAA